jgi:hypothetical protein
MYARENLRDWRRSHSHEIIAHQPTAGCGKDSRQGRFAVALWCQETYPTSPDGNRTAMEA